MKNIFKSLMLVAVAAMGIACQERFEENIAPINPNEVVMTITAGMDETRTWIDEANGKVQWSEGDQLKVIENSKTYRTTTATTIAADGTAKFKVAFPANTTDAEFTYNAIFPATAVVEDEAEKIDAAKVKVILKDQQKPTAASFDPAADILVAKQVVADAQPTELNMQFKRLVAMGKMTLNGLPADAKISQVVFTAGASDILAGRNYVNATTGKVLEYGYNSKTNVLTLSYDEAIATRDIYFVCNPFTMEAGETFKVKVVCEDNTYTKEFTIAEGRSLTFAEGNLGTFTVDMTGAESETSFSFANGKYVVAAKSGNKYYAMKGVSGGKYMTYTEVAYDGAAATFSTDDETLVWTIAAADGGYTFQNNEGKYLYWKEANDAYLGNAQTLTVTPIDNTNQYKVAVKNTPERLLGFNSNSGQERYAFYKGTQVHNLYLVPIAEDTTPRFEVGPKSLEFDSDANAIDDDFFTVTAVNGFDIATVTATTDAEWLYIDDSEASDGVWYMCPGANEGEARTADVVFSAEGLSVTVTVAQDAAPGAEDDTITVADFLAKKDTATEYTLTGKITNVANTTYGNFDLTDATGSVYVYGLLTPEGASQKQWAAAGLKLGDIITIKGKYNLYNGSPQIKNAVYVSHKSIKLDKESLEFAAEGGSLDITATLVNATDAISVSVDNTHYTVALKSGTTYTITAPANETGEAIYANLTFSAGELSAVVSLSQEAKQVEGEVVGGRDDFNTVTANSSYATRTTTNGWKGTNCAVMQGGTTDNNPTFKFIGSTSATRAFTMNGKTSAKGVITSPTLTTGCGKLSLKYGNAFSESNGVDFTITIKQNGTAVQTYKVDVNSITQKKVYTWEQDVNIAGDFVIEITNNSPSNNSSSNKDRVSIWDIVWTGYAE